MIGEFRVMRVPITVVTFAVVDGGVTFVALTFGQYLVNLSDDSSAVGLHVVVVSIALHVDDQVALGGEEYHVVSVAVQLPANLLRQSNVTLESGPEIVRDPKIVCAGPVPGGGAGGCEEARHLVQRQGGVEDPISVPLLGPMYGESGAKSYGDSKLIRSICLRVSATSAVS